MSGKTDGRRAYDAWWATAEGVPRHPDVTYDQDGAAWEAAAAAGAAAAHERTAELLSEVNGLRAERDSLRQDNDRISELLEKTSVAKCDAMDERDRLTERVAGVVTEGNELRRELAAEQMANVTWRSQNDYFRELVAEILDRFCLPGTASGLLEIRVLVSWVDELRARAGIDAPAVVTAGTEHLAEKIRGLAIPDAP